DPREKPLDRPLPLACQPPLFAAASRTYQLAGTPVSRTFNGRLARAAAPPPNTQIPSVRGSFFVFRPPQSAAPLRHGPVYQQIHRISGLQTAQRRAAFGAQ